MGVLVLLCLRVLVSVMGWVSLKREDKSWGWEIGEIAFSWLTLCACACDDHHFRLYKLRFRGYIRWCRRWRRGWH